MQGWLEAFLPDIVEYIGGILGSLLDFDIIGIMVGIIFAFIIIKAILRIVTG